MKTIVYQLLPRLFGNDNGRHVVGGSKEQNGCGLLNDINLLALRKIKELGATHVWYTGLLEHATCTDYTAFGILRDHRAMVKGKAGSPYAIKDYYDIDPDLASSPDRRMEEFMALVGRTHKAGLGFLMDFVPNHVARQYGSDSKPEGIVDLGEGDNGCQAFCGTNNFYYIPNQQLHCNFDMKGDEQEPYCEFPAKATGNDCFHAYPSINDWYETVKLNYGVDYCAGGQHRFRPLPDTWEKMLQILLFWASKGVDGFRCDMAEMVPCEFWEWAVKQVKAQYPQILFIGEVYNPDLYRRYIYQGGFDYLYDKVGLYDTLRAVTCGQRPSSDISECWKRVGDIQSHMLNFLENHDEQRLASDFFAADGDKGRSALIVSACMNTNPYMQYFVQEFGEKGMDREGFSGQDGRTTIFDYWSIPLLTKWRNGGKYNLEQMPTKAKRLYSFYKKILNLSKTELALSEGRFFDVMYANYDNPAFDSTKLYAFIRQAGKEAILVVCNFSDRQQRADVVIPQHAFDFLGIPSGMYDAKDLLSGKKQKIDFCSSNPVNVKVESYTGVMLKIQWS